MKSPTIMEADYISRDEKARYSEMQVMESAAGFYVGTWYTDHDGIKMPGSRDSFGYFGTSAEAQNHLRAIEEGRAEARIRHAPVRAVRSELKRTGLER